MRSVLGLLALLSSACAPVESTLIVQLVTDLTPGRELDAIELTVIDGAGETQSVRHAVDLFDALARPTRLAELSVAQGPARVTVATSFEGRAGVGTARVASVDGRTVVTVLLTRGCGLACGADQVCIGGRCDSIRCSAEHPELCLAECTTDADCGASLAACAPARCTPEGACVALADSSLCGAGYLCDSALGCQRVGDVGPDGTPAWCEGGVGGDPCVSIEPALPTSTLDGLLDCGASLADLPLTHWLGDAPIPADLHVRWSASWDGTSVVVYVEVDDPSIHPALAPDEPFCGDAIELYLDADGSYTSLEALDDPGAIQLVVSAPDEPGATRSGRYRYPGPLGEWSGEYRALRRPGGYALEARIDAAALDLDTWSPRALAPVGLSIGVDVSTADGSSPAVAGFVCGRRIGQLVASLDVTPGAACGGYPFCNGEAMCRPTLSNVSRRRP